MNNKLLIIVDMQKDFITGTLANKEAADIVPKIVEKINNWEGDIIRTFDTHTLEYLNTLEGQKLPVVHCIEGTDGWNYDNDIENALKNKNCCNIAKNTFGSFDLLVHADKSYDEIEICGTVASICVVSNALLLRAKFPNTKITVDRNCIADITEHNKDAAITVMSCCQIDVI